MLDVNTIQKILTKERCFLLEKTNIYRPDSDDYPKADLIIKNGTIFSADEKNSVYEALAVKNGTILAMGTNSDIEFYQDDNVKVIDLNGNTALPGFIDSHTHPSAAVNAFFGVDLNDLETTKQYLETIRGALNASPDTQMIYGYGWIMPAFKNGSPKKEDLDAITSDIPIVLWDQGYHNMWVNSKALETAGINSASYLELSDIVRSPSNEPTGLLKEAATAIMSDSLPDFSLPQYEQSLLAFQDQMLSKGITAVFDACVYMGEGKPGYPGNNALYAYRSLDEKQSLHLKYKGVVVIEPETLTKMNLTDQINDMISILKTRQFSIDTLKFYIDGTIEGETAYLYEDYIETPGYRGASNWDSHALNQCCAAFDRDGFRLHFHALGDAAVGQALDAIQYAAEQNPKGGKKGKHSITHLQLVTPDDLQRFKDLGVTAVVQPFWFHPDDFYHMLKKNIGPSRADCQYPLTSFLKKGILVASSSDYPVTPDPSPLTAVEIGITRRSPGKPLSEAELPPRDEKGTLEQLLRSFTIDGAKFLGLDDITGSLEPGKAADIVILDRDLFQIPVNQISQAKPVFTITDGKIMYNGGKKHA